MIPNIRRFEQATGMTILLLAAIVDHLAKDTVPTNTDMLLLAAKARVIGKELLK